MSTSNVRGRLFPGYADECKYHLSPGEAVWLELQSDDIVSCLPSAAMRIAVFDPTNSSDAIHHLLGNEQPPPPTHLPQHNYDDRMVHARLRGLNLSPESLVFYPFDGPLEAPVIWRSNAAMIFVAALPETPEALVTGSSNSGGAEIELQKQPSTVRLPTPLADIVDEFTVPRATAKAYQLPKGCYVQIIDIEGRQCSDFLAFNALALDDGTEKHIDNTVSRTFVRSAYPRPGLFDKFYDGDINPMLSIVQDTVGRHDTFALACTARGYEERGFPGHVNCSDNISAVMAPYGVKNRPAWPAINFFFNTWMTPDGDTLHSDEAWSRPGDYVLMRALDDLVCVSTACPDDIDPINGWNPTDIHVRIYSPKKRIVSALATRRQPAETAAMTTESPFHKQTSQHTKQYAAHLDYWLPEHYEALGAVGEYWACREKATMQDMSNLRILDIAGVDALPFCKKF